MSKNFKNKEVMSKYIIKKAMFEEALAPWVWTNDECIPYRKYIIVKNKKNNKSIKVFQRTLEENYVNRYNNSSSNIINLNNDKYIVISEYYRKKLGIDNNDNTADIEVKKAKCQFSSYHPDPTVQFAKTCSITALILGFISLIGVVKSFFC
jgi:hypothetical protein